MCWYALWSIPSPRGGFGGRSPTNWNMYTKLVVNIQCQAPLHERKVPPHKRKSPLLTTSWRRFCLCFYQRTFCSEPDLDLQCWWKNKKININILIAKGGLEPFQPPLAAPLHSVITSISNIAWCTEKDDTKWSIQEVVMCASLMNVNVSWNSRRSDLDWCQRSNGERRSWLFPLGCTTVQGCWMMPRSPGSSRQGKFCCNPSWHAGSWSRQHRPTDWGVGTSGWPLG